MPTRCEETPNENPTRINQGGQNSELVLEVGRGKEREARGTDQSQPQGSSNNAGHPVTTQEVNRETPRRERDNTRIANQQPRESRTNSRNIQTTLDQHFQSGRTTTTVQTQRSTRDATRRPPKLRTRANIRMGSLNI